MRAAVQGRVMVLGGVYLLLGAAAVTMLVLGLQQQDQRWATGALVGGLVGLMLVATTAPLALLLVGLAGRLREAAGLQRTLSQIHEHSMLSDNAKRVLFRDREVDLLRNAIEDDIGRGDYHAAITLCDEMGDVFGYRQEAEAFRSRILQSRQQQYELEVQAALDQLDAALSDRAWARVHDQAARIRRLYPDSHVVGELDRRIQAARDEHKHELQTRLREAAEQDDPRAAMELLKQLDRYLSPEEAGELTGIAQGVITRYRETLSTQFRLAVSEHRWAEAAGVGEIIIAEYPNTQMAAEVRSMIAVLRTRAGQSGVVSS